MPTLTRTHSALLAILILALLMRLPGVMYGLPFHLYGDEEVNVYSALKMIELRTIFPVFHPDAFAILYEPPLLAIFYAFAFIPVTGALYVLQGFPAFADFANTIVIDPTPFWIMGRLVVIAFSLGSIYLVYRIGELLFEKRNAALLSSLFLATSFFHVSLAATTRHWEIVVFFSLLALFFALSYLRTPHPRKLLAGGIALGLSFSSGYLPFFIPPIGLVLLFALWQQHHLTIQRYIGPLLIFGIPFITIAGLAVLIAPKPFSGQVVNHVYSHTHTILGFLKFYSLGIINYETPLIVALLGACGLFFQKRYDLLIFFFSFFVSALIVMFFFMVDIERYLFPLLPMLSLLAGYGVHALETFLGPKLRVACIVFVLLYAGTLFGRLGLLEMRNDTKIHAASWIESNLPSGSTLIVDSERMRFHTGESAAKNIEHVSPDILRGTDKLALRGIEGRFNAYHTNLALPLKQEALIASIRAQNTSFYVVTDSWSESPTIQNLVKERKPIATFGNESAFPVPRGLYIGGEEHTGEKGSHLLSMLWNTRYLGADVYVYELNN